MYPGCFFVEPARQLLYRGKEEIQKIIYQTFSYTNLSEAK
jgi:hypothetical protein